MHCSNLCCPHTEEHQHITIVGTTIRVTSSMPDLMLSARTESKHVMHDSNMHMAVC